MSTPKPYQHAGMTRAKLLRLDDAADSLLAWFACDAGDEREPCPSECIYCAGRGWTTPDRATYEVALTAERLRGMIGRLLKAEGGS